MNARRTVVAAVDEGNEARLANGGWFGETTNSNFRRPAYKNDVGAAAGQIRQQQG